MTESMLTQSDADALIAVEKHSATEDQHEFPITGGKISIPLLSVDKREKFSLDIYRGRIDLAKVTYQNRVRHTIPLIRVDLGGPPHVNPDGMSIPCPHMHVYREGFDDKWAQILPKSVFNSPNDLWETLQDFYKVCNITKLPSVERGLFT